MASSVKVSKVLVMGIGNTLLQDDGVGIHVTERFKQSQAPDSPIEVIDGGTIGLALLPDIEDADAVVIVDAAELGERPGTIRIFRDREIDRLLSGKKRTVHEVALADLFSAAEIRGRCPRVRALIAIQPACTEWGLEPTAKVQASVPLACEAVDSLTKHWLQDEAAA